MKRKISILGCGWLGLPLAEEFIKDGSSVKGSCRITGKMKSLKAVGVQPFQIDISNDKTEFNEFLDSEILVIAITSKSISDFQNLVEKIEKSSVQKVIFISSTSVYPFTNGVVTETSVVKEIPLVEIEQIFRKNTRFKTTIIRFGGLFGGNRKPGNFIKPNKPMQNPDGFINLIHREDCIAVIKQIITKDSWGETFNSCADTHPTRREFYTKQAYKLGKSTPVFNEVVESQYKIINSDKLKKQLSFTFKYGDLMAY